MLRELTQSCRKLLVNLFIFGQRDEFVFAIFCESPPFFSEKGSRFITLLSVEIKNFKQGLPVVFTNAAMGH